MQHQLLLNTKLEVKNHRKFYAIFIQRLATFWLVPSHNMICDIV
jgi:hypothetical protein